MRSLQRLPVGIDPDSGISGRCEVQLSRSIPVGSVAQDLLAQDVRMSAMLGEFA
jgi:hypothetical protein